jgi:hypothetical protein
MVTTGVEETLALYESAVAAAGDGLADATHDAIVAEYRRRQSRIPFESGALRKALTDPSDRFHSVEVKVIRKGWALEVGVSGNFARDQVTRATVFQKKRIPQPVTKRVVAAVHAEYEAQLGVLASSGDSLIGDVGLGKLRRRSKRKSRRGRRRK